MDNQIESHNHTILQNSKTKSAHFRVQKIYQVSISYLSSFNHIILSILTKPIENYLRN